MIEEKPKREVPIAEDESFFTCQQSIPSTTAQGQQAFMHTYSPFNYEANHVHPLNFERGFHPLYSPINAAENIESNFSRRQHQPLARNFSLGNLVSPVNLNDIRSMSSEGFGGEPSQLPLANSNSPTYPDSFYNFTQFPTTYANADGNTDFGYHPFHGTPWDISQFSFHDVTDETVPVSIEPINPTPQQNQTASSFVLSPIQPPQAAPSSPPTKRSYKEVLSKVASASGSRHSSSSSPCASPNLERKAKDEPVLNFAPPQTFAKVDKDGKNSYKNILLKPTYNDGGTAIPTPSKSELKSKSGKTSAANAANISLNNRSFKSDKSHAVKKPLQINNNLGYNANVEEKNFRPQSNSPLLESLPPKLKNIKPSVSESKATPTLSNIHQVRSASTKKASFSAERDKDPRSDKVEGEERKKRDNLERNGNKDNKKEKERSKKKDNRDLISRLSKFGYGKLISRWSSISFLFLRWLIGLLMDVISLSSSLVWHWLVSNSVWLQQVTLQGWNHGKHYSKLVWQRYLNPYWEARPWKTWFGKTGSKNDLPPSLANNLPLPTTGEEAMKRLLSCKGRDPYSILGVSRNCTDEDIRRYYKKQAVLVHPDKNKQRGAEEAFKILAHAFELIGEPESRRQYDQIMQEAREMEDAWSELSDLISKLHNKMDEAANTIRCTNCSKRHRRFKTSRPCYAARYCKECKIHHSAREGDLWAESRMGGFLWYYYACMEGAVYDITEWAGCQAEHLKHLTSNSHRVQYRIVPGPGHSQNPPAAQTRRKSEGDHGPEEESEDASDPELQDLLRDLYGRGMGPGTANPNNASKSQASKKKTKKKNK